MRNVVARLGALFGLLFFLSVADIAVSGYLQPRGVFRAISEEAPLISGNVSARIPSIGDLVFRADSPLVNMEFLEADGAMWRGRLLISPSVRHGEFRFRVHLKSEGDGSKLPERILRVYPDRTAYLASSHYLCERFLGIPPSWLAAAVLPLLLLSLGVSYRLSARKEALLNAMGMATVFKVSRRKGGCEIMFGIGSGDGVREGEIMILLDADRRPVGRVKVRTAGERHATAEVDPNLRVKPNYLVAKFS